MELKDKFKSSFENQPIYRDRTQYTNIDMKTKLYENQQFIVPWQMSKVKEKEYLVK